ncbi:MAG: DUF4347 domain-containing protein, partial [Gammaproteobacteria bacterium]|nr:DUF4347 domain-containing protein [Gammaproteobacteria bacterium]
MSNKARLLSLEPRVLLDAAGIISGVDAYVDSTETAAEFEKSQQSFRDRAVIEDVVAPASGGKHNSLENTEGLADVWQLSQSAQSALTNIDDHALIVVDTSIENYQSLLVSIDPNAEVLYLDSAKDGLLQLAEYVRSRSDISAIHILSHGGE